MQNKHRAAGPRLRLPALLLGVVLPVLAGCLSTVSDAAAVPAAQFSVPRGNEFFYGNGSFWRTPVPANAAIDRRSAAYVAALASTPPAVAVRNFTAAVFVANAETPRYRIQPTASYAPATATLNRVPIPGNAAPDPASDGHMAVLDTSTNCVYEMYRAKRTPQGWSAEWVNATPADGNGVYPDGMASRASGFSVAAGLIWPDELRAGNIDHALVFAYPRVRNSGPVAPATRSDGTVNGPDTLPEGAHLVLDPSLDLSTLGLSGPELTIATALQRYGMYLADSGRGLVLYAVHPQSFPGDPYLGLFQTGTTYEGISKIPFNRMKVLKLGTPQPAYQGPIESNRCSDAAR